jgi:hypothetical protein
MTDATRLDILARLKQWRLSSDGFHVSLHQYSFSDSKKWMMSGLVLFVTGGEATSSKTSHLQLSTEHESVLQ